MADNNNGHNDVTQKEIDELLNSIKDNPIDNAFKYSEGGFNASKAMVELKEKLELNALLLDIPDRRFVVAVKYAYLLYKKYHQQDRIDAMMVQLGMMASIKGRRVQLFSDTIVGERKNYNSNQGGGLLDKLNKFNGDTK